VKNKFLVGKDGRNIRMHLMKEEKVENNNYSSRRRFMLCLLKEILKEKMEKI